jgi:4-alpha-glucanotransferase
MSIIQFLPLNDTGFDFRPYDCQSGFALDPMYLSLSEIKGVDSKLLRDEIENLRENFPISGRVNYRIKKAKLDILWRIFKEVRPALAHKKEVDFQEYQEKNKFWLRDYCLFKVIKEENGGKSWEDWDQKFKDRDKSTLEIFERENKEKIEFQAWLQWQSTNNSER